MTDTKNSTNETFNTLEKYDTIIAYTNNEDIPEKFVQDAEANAVTVDLTNEELRKCFFENYKIEKLPCLITAGVPVYDNENYKESLEKAKAHAYEKTVLKINTILEKHENFVFIKGTPTRPECGFTSQLITLLKDVGLENGKDYGFLNIYEHENIRQALKKLNNWKTFPQVYLNGEFCGGLDVLRDMEGNGSLQELVAKYRIKANIQ